jgi:hypothetical protein
VSNIDKNFLINMSPLLIASVIMLAFAIAYDLTRDEIVGYTEHGVPVYESEIKESECETQK